MFFFGAVMVARDDVFPTKRGAKGPWLFSGCLGYIEDYKVTWGF